MCYLKTKTKFYIFLFIDSIIQYSTRQSFLFFRVRPPLFSYSCFIDSQEEVHPFSQTILLEGFDKWEL